jgi:hypothetical protein
VSRQSGEAGLPGAGCPDGVGTGMGGAGVLTCESAWME